MHFSILINNELIKFVTCARLYQFVNCELHIVMQIDIQGLESEGETMSFELLFESKK